MRITGPENMKIQASPFSKKWIVAFIAFFMVFLVESVHALPQEKGFPSPAIVPSLLRGIDTEKNLSDIHDPSLAESPNVTVQIPLAGETMKIKEDFTGILLLAMAASKEGIDKEPEFLRVMERTKIELLAQAYLEHVSRDWDLSEAALKTFYNEHLPRYFSPAAVCISHILVHEEDLAFSIILKHMSGISFCELAASYSRDLATASEGGFLGWFSRGDLPETMTEIFDLGKGDISFPLESDYGYHIVRCIDRKPSFQIPFPEVEMEVYKDLIESYVEKEIISVEKTWVRPGLLPDHQVTQ